RRRDLNDLLFVDPDVTFGPRAAVAALRAFEPQTLFVPLVVVHGLDSRQLTVDSRVARNARQTTVNCQLSTVHCQLPIVNLRLRCHFSRRIRWSRETRGRAPVSRERRQRPQRPPRAPARSRRAL